MTRPSVRHAMAYSFGQRYVAFVIQFGLSIIMARLLSPEETGIYSLAAGVVAIAGMLRDFGVSEYVIQEKKLTHEGLRSALGLTFIISWGIALLLFGTGSVVAAFYKEPGIVRIIHVLVLNFVLLPMGTMTFAMLNKEMAFKSIFWVQTLSNLTGAVVCVGLAYQGFSYMSMPWSSLVSISMTIVLLALIRPKETFMLPSFTGLGTAIRFGGTLTIGRLADQLCQRAPDFLIGNFLGFHAVGIYSKASSLLGAFHDFFASALGRVALPAFAKIKHDKKQIEESYARTIELTSLFPMVFFGLCALFAEPIILLLFGNQWLEAVPVVRLLGLNGIVGAPYLLAGSVLTANGQVRDLLRIQLTGAAIFIPAIYVAAHYSLEIVAIVGILSGIPRLVLMQLGLKKGLNFSVRRIMQTVWPSLMIAAAILAGASLALFFYRHTPASGFITLLAAVSLSLTLGLVLILKFEHPLAMEIRLAWSKLANVF